MWQPNASKCMHVRHNVGFRKLLVLGRLTLVGKMLWESGDMIIIHWVFGSTFEVELGVVSY